MCLCSGDIITARLLSSFAHLSTVFYSLSQPSRTLKFPFILLISFKQRNPRHSVYPSR